MHINENLNRIIISKPRRGGQALILSVLIMIFIVLLGTTFISIVASNMSNTARTSAKDEARQAANAGIQFADNRLSGSMAGLQWRPDQTNTGSTYYYTSFDRAQGWSQEFFNSYLSTTTNPTPAKARFVKYPNPDGGSVDSATNTANFMLRVSQVENGDADIVGDTKIGDIRIESIGFASDDPTAYYRVVAYKKGTANNPLTAAMRSISNWDFSKETVPYATIVRSDSDTSFIVANAESKGLAKDDVVTVFDPVSGEVGSGEINDITSPSVPYPTTATIQLKAALAFTPNARSIIQKAATFGIPDNLQVQFDNQTSTPVKFHVSASKDLAGNNVNTPGSVWVNGGLVWAGQDFLTHLVADTPGTLGSNIKVTGVFTKTAGADVKASAGDATTAVDIPVSSADPNYASNPLVAAKLVEDGANRLRGSSDPTRQVKEFTPPDITAGGEGFGRYRQLTQYSSPSNPSDPPQAGAYGYGRGIYINNLTDVEMVDGKAMTQSDLQKLWYDDAGPEYGRTSQPAAPASTNKSLEQQHLRGWVSPDQFLPRGAEVVLNDTTPPTITVTLDARSDNDSDVTNGYENLYATGSNKGHLMPNKMWRAEDGTILTGVYTKTFLWPANGTIFAEGNIRIRGKISSANTPGRSLTVVSMNNIYIEGSLSAGDSKVLLLAKKNVIVNPTQVLIGTESISMLSDAVTGGNTIMVADATRFREGDYISINDSITRQIIDVTGNTLTLDGGALGNYNIGDIVHVVYDPTIAGTALPATVATRIQNFSQAITRRVHVNAGDPTNIRLAFRHSAEYKKALTVQIDPTLDGNATPGTRIDAAELYNKAMGTSSDPVITSDHKLLQIDHTETPIAANGTLLPQTSGTDDFANNLAATPYQTNTGDPTDITAAENVSIGDLYKQMLDKYDDPHWDYGNVTITPGTPPTASVIGSSVQNNLIHTGPATTTTGNQWVNIDEIGNTTDPNLYHTNNANHPRFYFMASVGNRSDFGVAAAGAYFPTIKQTVYPAPAEPFIIPMATSVWLKVNGVQATLQGDQWNASLGSFFNVLQFGFAPLFVNLDNASNPIVTSINDFNGNPVYADSGIGSIAVEDYAANEDVLTSDQYFYQPYGKEAINDDGYGSATNYSLQTKYDNDAKYTLDSRLIANPGVTVGDNVLVLAMNNAEVGGRSVSNYFQNSHQIPFYRISNLKLENETFDTGTHELSQIGAGATLEINAFVYAQEGGWQVIPGAYFDNAVQNGQDLNRDGVLSTGEQTAAYRYNRYNYQIVFHGAIMENETASMNHVKDWTDKWATVKMDVSSAPAYNFGDTGDPQASNFNTILYFYDPTAAQGALAADVGFHVPVASGDLIYQG